MKGKKELCVSAVTGSAAILSGIGAANNYTLYDKFTIIYNNLVSKTVEKLVPIFGEARAFSYRMNENIVDSYGNVRVKSRFGGYSFDSFNELAKDMMGI